MAAGKIFHAPPLSSMLFGFVTPLTPYAGLSALYMSGSRPQPTNVWVVRDGEWVPVSSVSVTPSP